jgi:hypothetical protein
MDYDRYGCLLSRKQTEAEDEMWGGRVELHMRSLGKALLSKMSVDMRSKLWQAF